MRLKKLSNRILAAFLAVVMVLSLMPFTAVQAAETTLTGAQFTIGTSSAIPGETVELIAKLENAPLVKSMAISDITYDAEKMTLTNVEWLCDAEIKNWNPAQGRGVLTFGENTDANGPVLKMTFKINNVVADSDVSISCAIILKAMDANSDEVPVETTVIPGKVEIRNEIPGDMDSNEKVNSDDAVYLLYHTLFGNEEYPIKQNGDIDGNGKTNSDDAVYLLYHTLFGEEEYPLFGACAHTGMTAVAAKPATCTEDGNIAYWHCSKCNTYFSDAAATTEIAYAGTVVVATGHDEVVDSAVAPSYTETGLTEGSHCSVCGEVIVAQETIPMLEATYHAITYKNLNGADSPEITRYTEHEGLLDMPEPSVDGYKFVGWYTQSVGGTIVDYIPAGSTQDYVLFAHWELETYTITYKDAPVNSNVTTYTVEDRIVLTDPQWSGLKFVEWTDAEGQPCPEIAKGTTGDMELTANWQLLENTSVPAEGIRELWTDYDERNGHQIFIYELGKIHHVVLEELDSKYKYYGESLEWQEEKTVSLDESVSSEVSTAVSNSVTKTSEHEITNDWTKSHSDTYERGFHVGVEWSPIKDILKFEAGGEFNWSDTNESSWSESTTNSEGLAESIENTTSNSSTVAYNQTISRSFATSATIGEDMPEGEYRYVYYGTVRVFAVVTYEPSSGNYRLDTVSVLDEGIGSMPLYTPPANTTANIQVSGGLPCVFPLEELEAFIADSYYVTYDSNGGTGSMYSGYYPTNQEHTLSDNLFVKPGYTWAGWKVDGTEKTVQKDELVSNLGNNGQQITAVAQWAKNSYTVTYNGNKPANASSSVLSVPGNTACIYDENVTLGKAPTLTGWTFGGWFKDAACTVKVGNAEEILSTPNLATAFGSTVTLYAKWTPNTYTVSYHANNGTGTTVTSIHAYDTSSSLSANGFTRAEYTFLGWSTDSTATTPTYTDKQTIKNLATSGNVTLYAVWVKTSATVQFTPDNGTRDITFTEGKTRTESINTNMSISDLTKNGYTSVTISVSFDCKSENNLIMFNSAALKVVARNTDLYSGSWHLKKNMSGSWENKTVTLTVDLTKLNEDASFSLVWSQPSGTGNGEEWYLGTTVVTVTAKK